MAKLKLAQVMIADASNLAAAEAVVREVRFDSVVAV
jgi:hypothetical protein